MTKTKRHLIERYPDYGAQIEKLSGNNPNFDALCHAFEEASSDLSRLEVSPEADAEARARALRQRCADLEQELLALMQQNIRV